MIVDKIFCLSLEKDLSRRHNFIQNFSKLGMPIEFHFGIDGNQMSVEQPKWLANKIPHLKYNKDIIKSIEVLNVSLSNPEKACALGHIEIWNKIKDLNKDYYYLVCEDDSVISNMQIAKETLENLKNEKVPNGIIYFGYTTSKPEKSMRIILKKYAFKILKTCCFKGSKCRVLFNELTIDQPTKIRGKHLIMRSGQHWGAFAYAITPDIANQLIMLNKDLIITSDGTFRYVRLAEIFPVYVLKNGLIRVDKTIKSNIRSEENQNYCFANFDFS